MKTLFSLLACCAAVMALGAPVRAEEPSAGQPGVFVVTLKLGDSGDMAADAKVLEGHIAYLNQLYDQGVLFLAGPFADSYHEGQSVILASSAEEARALAGGDPSVQAGLMTIEAVHPWWTAFSLPDKRRFSVEDFKAMMASAPAEGAPAETAAAAGSETAATTSAAEPAASEESAGMGQTPGAISWIEIPSANPEASQAFYSKVFGWEVSSQDNMHFYTTPDSAIGGLFNPEMKIAASNSGPQFYINCKGLKAKLEEVKAAGGKVVTEPMQLPNEWGFIARIADPEGNEVGLWSATE